MAPQTWHYGLVAKWWAEFNEGGPEIDYFRRFIERDGQPALDVACGTGRLLLPYLRAGLDVDGCDVSEDMIALCRERAEREGLSPTLFVQSMHELDPPRSYRTIIVCGGFAVGSDRAHDLQALARFYEHLEPGGTLVLDNEVPYANTQQWSRWLREERAELPRAVARRRPGSSACVRRQRARAGVRGSSRSTRSSSMRPSRSARGNGGTTGWSPRRCTSSTSASTSRTSSR